VSRRKNTAEAFEILAEIAREKELGKPPGAAPPAPEAPSNFRLLSREPLLKAPGGIARPKWRWNNSQKPVVPPGAPREEAGGAARSLRQEAMVPPVPQAPPPVAAKVVEEPRVRPERRQPLLARWCSERPRSATSIPGALPAPAIASEPGAGAALAPWSEMEEVETAVSARPMRIELLEAREPPARFDPDPWAVSHSPGESRDRALVSGGGGHPGPASAARGDEGGSPPFPKPAPGGTVPTAPRGIPSQAPVVTASPAPAATAPQAPVVAVSQTPEITAPEAPESDAAIDVSREAVRLRVRSGVVVIGSKWLERPIEVRLSTALALGMTGMIAIVLFLTYLELPPAEDAALRNFVALAPEGAPDSSPPAFLESPQSEDHAAASAEAPPLEGLSRPVPIWSPRTVSPEGTSRETGSLPPGGAQAEAAAPPPEIRNIETAAEPPGSGGAPVPDPGASTLAAREGTGVIHRIQVRAKESMKGAQQIVAYLERFGFDPGQTLIERDRHGDQNAEGLPLYTVFVGAYESREAALPHLEKLKEETRRLPFQDKAAFRDMFHDALVVRRRR